MDLLFWIGLLVVLLVIIFFSKILSVALKVLFYTLLVLLVFVFVFGVSYQELLNKISDIILWFI